MGRVYLLRLARNAIVSHAAKLTNSMPKIYDELNTEMFDVAEQLDGAISVLKEVLEIKA
jgi:hypothetical protein